MQQTESVLVHQSMREASMKSGKSNDKSFKKKNPKD